MKVTPTSGPIASSSTHHARDAISSRYSFTTSQRKEEKTAEDAKAAETTAFSAFSALSGVFSSLREGKEHLFEIARRCAARCGLRRELLERAFAADRSAADQDEAIAHPRRVLDLMDREEHRPALGRIRA